MDFVINCKLILIHNSQKSTALTNFITEKLSSICHIKFSSTLTAHYVFSSKPGSIGFLVLNDYYEELLSIIERLQSSFKWSFIIFVNAPQGSFRDAQIDISAGPLKVIKSASSEETFELMLRIVSYLSDERRMQEQIDFFEREEASLLNRSAFKSILASMLRDIVGVADERDLMALTSAYSFKRLLHATTSEFEDMLARGDLLEPSSVDKLRAFVQHFN